MKAISSGLQDDDAAIFAGPCWYLGGVIVTDADDDVILTIYDDPDSADGTKIDYFRCTDQVLTEFHSLEHPVWCANGIYADMDAKEGDYIIWYAL